MSGLSRGRLVQDKITKTPRLNCRNWECGVVLPVPTLRGPLHVELGKSKRGEASSAITATAVEGLDIFEDSVPVPLRGPARSMQKAKPWFNDG